MNSEMNSQSQHLVEGASGDQYTPESESSVEGYQNYTASEAFIQGLAGIVNQSDVENMIRAQKQMLQRFEKTNEMLLNCNALSQNRLKSAGEEFKKHVKLLNEMKKDLDYIFKKLRIIKAKLSQQYPQVFAEAQPQRSSLALEAKDDGEKPATASRTAASTTELKKEQSVVSLNNQRTQEKPSDAESKATTTVEYVQMEETVENGKPIENELIKRVCSIELTNPNDSSDCTSEDTG